MRVAIILTRIENSGPVKVIQHLANSLRLHESVILNVYYLDKRGCRDLSLSLPAEWLDKRTFCFSEYDIIHTNGIRPDLFAYRNRKKIRYHVSTIHNFVFEDLAYRFNPFMAWILGYIWLNLWRRADKLICVSKSMKTYYTAWLGSSGIEVIYNGIAENDEKILPDADILNVIEGFRSKNFRVLGNAGQLTKIKGIEQVLYLISKQKELAFIIIGAGSEIHRLKKIAGKLNIAERCFFCGSRNNAASYFKYFDLFVMSSRSEGFGLAMIEAVQQKIPVVCSDINVFKELFNKEEVTYFRLDDLASLTAAAELALKSGQQKSELAYARYYKNYSAAKMSEDYYQLYRSLCHFQIN